MCMLGLRDEASEGRQRANNAMRSSKKEQRERREGERGLSAPRAFGPCAQQQGGVLGLALFRFCYRNLSR